MTSASKGAFVELLKNKQQDKAAHPLHREAQSPAIYAAPPIDQKAEQLRLERVAQLQLTNEDIEAVKSGMKTSFVANGSDRVISRWELFTLPIGLVNAIFHESSTQRKVYEGEVEEVTRKLDKAKEDGDEHMTKHLSNLLRIVDAQRRMYIRYSYTAEAIATCGKAARQQLKEEGREYTDGIRERDKQIAKLKAKLEKLTPQAKPSLPPEPTAEPRSIEELSKMAEELTLEVACQHWSAAEVSAYSECLKNEKNYLDDENADFDYQEFQLEKMLRENALEDLLCLEAELQEARELNRRYREGIA